MRTPDGAAPRRGYSEARSAVFDDAEPVLPGTTHPLFGDDVWEFDRIRRSQAEKGFDLATIPLSWRLTAREICMTLAQPDHPAVVAAGVVRRARAAVSSTLIGTLYQLRTVAVWAEREGIGGPSAFTSDVCLRFNAALRTGRHASPARPVSSSTSARYLATIRLLHDMAEVLTEGGLVNDPLGPQGPVELAGHHPGVENVTPPLPFAQWSTAVSSAWTVVDILGPDIVRAERVRRALPQEARGTVSGALDLIDAHVEGGGLIPLHTGYGRNPRPRGEPNYRLLARMLGFSCNCFNPAAGGYKPEVIKAIDHYGAQPGVGVLGGLMQTTAVVDVGDSPIPWSAELGAGEVEHLTSVLRGASYVLLCALTAMRDSEIQEVASDAIGTCDGIPALRSVQRKGRSSDRPVERWWLAPAPVLRTIEVLAGITRDDDMIFARSANKGPYAPSRDIRRFVQFVNSPPEERVGRGGAIFTAPIDHRINLTQQTLRRSFAVYAARYPDAELGLGVQLGHAALRMTAGYYLVPRQATFARFTSSRSARLWALRFRQMM